MNGMLTLSLGGKEVLLKSVAMTLHVYAMSCFKLTKNQSRKINSAMTQFWWNSCEGKRKKLCKSKKEGGIGLKDIEDFNQAFLAKQAWCVRQSPKTLLSQI